MNRDATDPGKPFLISLNDVCKDYRLGNLTIQVLKHISLHVETGDYLAIMGPSGSGKSTLMNILGCLDSPTSGEYYFDGMDVSGLDDKALSMIRNRRIGFVFQNFSLLPRVTAVRNVELPMIYRGVSPSDRTLIAMELLRKVGLEDRMFHKPAELSGGQKQRVAIARALANRPSVILADEPTGNLDSITGRSIMALFGKLHEEGNTIILVTHDGDIARNARRIVRLHDGEIVSAVR